VDRGRTSGLGCVSAKEVSIVRRLRAFFFALIAVLLSTTFVYAAYTVLWVNGTTSPTMEDYLRDKVKAEHYRVCGRSITYHRQNVWAARYKAMDMGVHNKMAHLLSDGTMLWDHYSVMGISSRASGENIAWNNYPDGQSEAVAWNGWMNSPGHRAIIQDCKYTRFGIGVYKTKAGGDLGGKWFAAEFTMP